MDDQGYGLASTEIYSLATNQFLPGPELPAPILDHCMFKINQSHVGLVGGRSFDEQEAKDWVESRDIFILDLNVGVWNRMGEGLRVGRNNHACGVVNSAERGLEILVAGRLIFLHNKLELTAFKLEVQIFFLILRLDPRSDFTDRFS